MPREKRTTGERNEMSRIKCGEGKIQGRITQRMSRPSANESSCEAQTMSKFPNREPTSDEIKANAVVDGSMAAW